MTTRRELLLAAGALLATPFARSQQPGKVYQVGILSIGSNPAGEIRWQPFVEAMRQLNYVEGRNLVIRRAFGDGKADRLPGLIADLLGAKVDIIVTTGDREVKALKRATNSIPVIFTFVVDPVAQGFVASLARPGGNITGFTSLVPGLNKKHVELLREAIPSAARFSIVATASNTTPEIRQEYDAAARALGITVSVENVTDRNSYDGALGRAKKSGAAGIIVPMDGETFRYRQALAQLALDHRLPGIYGDVMYVEEGGLMTYSASFADRLRGAAAYVDKVLRGARPADLPVQQPTKLELVINMNTAKALGVVIPQSILIRADRVFE